MKPQYYLFILVAIGVVAASVLTSHKPALMDPAPESTPDLPVSARSEQYDPGKGNRIVRTEIRKVTGPNGPTSGMMISVDAPNAATFNSLVPSIILTFKSKRVTSPPDTSFLLITLVGNVTAPEFKKMWEANAINDRTVKEFLSKLDKADILHGNAEGEQLDSASLK